MIKTTAEEISNYLKGKRSSNGFEAKCPTHDDKKASLSTVQPSKSKAGSKGGLAKHKKAKAASTKPKPATKVASKAKATAKRAKKKA